jgi:hypothetical protein
VNNASALPTYPQDQKTTKVSVNLILDSAEQLTAIERWYRILSQALIKYLRGRQLRPPLVLQPP